MCDAINQFNLTAMLRILVVVLEELPIALYSRQCLLRQGHYSLRRPLGKLCLLKASATKTKPDNVFEYIDYTMPGGESLS